MSQPEASALPGTPAPVSFYENPHEKNAAPAGGFFDNWRIAVAIFTQILFYVSPWLV